HRCLGSITLPTIVSSQISDNCSKNFQHHILINNQESKKPGDVVELPLGTHTAIYTVIDEVGNKTSCSFTITVEDKTAPVASCKEFIVMSLSQGGGYLTTAMIDNGSKDECSLVTTHIRRMSDPSDIPYRDTINVSCADVEKPFMVMLRVMDAAGNANTCMTTVTIQDKSVPTLIVPKDTLVTCAEWAQNSNPASYGSPEAYDQCTFTLEETVKENLNNCKVGTVVRTFVAKDASHTITRSQTITIINSTLADLAAIKAPRDTVLSGMCTVQSLHPDSLAKLGVAYGRPIIPSNACFNLGISYKDEIFTTQGPVNTNCFKLIRTWRFINWCESPVSTLELKQTIAVTNKVAPTISLLTS
ncbi:MAG TPA: HYR domain-containing protein, partial [Saprospiraceae bacterium]|nr:HYR domain-containing protein [Saprospiraceae bacterium]